MTIYRIKGITDISRWLDLTDRENQDFVYTL